MYLARAKDGAVLFFCSLLVMGGWLAILALYRPLFNLDPFTIPIICLTGMGTLFGLYRFLKNLRAQDRAEMDEVLRKKG